MAGDEPADAPEADEAGSGPAESDGGHTDEPHTDEPHTDEDHTDEPHTDEPHAAGARPREQMASAVGAIRREGQKVAVIYAVVDAVALALSANLLVQLGLVPVVPDTVGLPGILLAPAELLGVTMADSAVSGASLVAVLAGVAAFAVEFVVRTRRPLVEQFEAANPPVREALRTARDAVEGGQDGTIARRLYEDVLETLSQTSSVALLDVRRVGATLVVVLLLSLASVQVAAMGLTLGFGDGPTGSDGDGSDRYTGLHDGEEILGEPTDADSGDDDIQAEIGTSGDGRGNASDLTRAYETSGFTATGDVESQQAGFAPAEQLEDAALIREYNLRIREQTDE